MSVEPVQELVRILLESQGYWVRANARFPVKSATKTGNTSAYSDVDILAIRVDPETGQVTDRIWAEVKAHLTLRLRPSYLKEFLREYAVFLDLTAIGAPAEQMPKLLARQEQAHHFVRSHLGATFEKRLYFAGPRPNAKDESEVQALLPGVSILYVQDLLGEHMGKLTHKEGNETVIRVINLLQSLGFLKQ